MKNRVGAGSAAGRQRVGNARRLSQTSVAPLPRVRKDSIRGSGLLNRPSRDREDWQPGGRHGRRGSLAINFNPNNYYVGSEFSRCGVARIGYGHRGNSRSGVWYGFSGSYHDVRTGPQGNLYAEVTLGRRPFNRYAYDSFHRTYYAPCSWRRPYYYRSSYTPVYYGYYGAGYYGSDRVSVDTDEVYINNDVSYVNTTPRAEPTDSVATLISHGNAAFASHRYSDARRLYIRAVLMDDANGEAVMLYGLANFAMADYEAAADSIRRAMTLDPTLIDRPIELHGLYQDDTMLDIHVDALVRHVTSQGPRQNLLFLLGYLYYSLGQPQYAQTIFNDLATAHEDDLLARIMSDVVNQIVDGVPAAESEPAAPIELP